MYVLVSRAFMLELLVDQVEHLPMMMTKEMIAVNAVHNSKEVSMKQGITVLILSATILCLNGFIFASPIKEIPGFVWKRDLGNDKFDYESKAAAVSPTNGDLIITGQSVDYRNAQAPRNIYVWWVNGQGKTTKAITLKDSNGQGYFDVAAMSLLSSGEILLAAETQTHQKVIIKIDQDGKPLFTVPIAVAKDFEILLCRIVPLIDNKFIVIGYSTKSKGGADGLIIKFDSLGHVLWRKTVSRSKIDWFWDGMATSDGGFTLVGNSGNYESGFVGSCNVWVTKFDGTGNAQSETVFPGRFGRMTTSQEGGYVIAYDKDTYINPDIRLQALSPALQQKWGVHVLTTNKDFPRAPRMARTPANDFIVVGGKGGKERIIGILWIKRIKSNGEVSWEFSADDSVKDSTTALEYDLVSSNETFYVLYPNLIEVRSGGTRQKVRVIKFIQK